LMLMARVIGIGPPDYGFDDWIVRDGLAAIDSDRRTGLEPESSVLYSSSCVAG
jgi:hypothetical protein